MSGLLYSFVKLTVKLGLYFYHKRISIFGLENIPKDKPVLFLPNHQNALIDVLLIATDCKRKPFFLTRADVFSNSVLKSIFSYFRMLPIYRMRDGRETLSNNKLVFDACADLLNKGGALVVFPEASHNLKRSIRPLSKGFTRIISRAFELYPNMDLQIIPVGLNYKNALEFPDQVSVYYGEPISAKSLFDKADLNESSAVIKNKVEERLRQLTSHVPENLNYEATIRTLQNENADFLNPDAINTRLKSFIPQKLNASKSETTQSAKTSYLTYIFMLLNLPIVLFWRLAVKPKVLEPEFIGTFKFATGMVLFPCYLIILLLLLSFFLNFNTALFCLILLTVSNIMLVKLF